MKKIILLPIICFFVIMMAGLVSATTTCTVDRPGASATIKGNYVFNISNTATAVGGNISNCTATGSSSTSGGSWTGIVVYNSTEGNWSNNTIYSGGQKDSTDWTFTFSCYNGSNDAVNLIETCSRSSIIVDNHKPVITGCTIEGSTAANGTVTESSFPFVCTIYNASGCNAYWKDSTADAFASSTQSGVDYELSAITFTSSFSGSGTTATANLKQAGDNYQTLYMDCTDGTNTTTGTNYKTKLVGETDIQEQIDTGQVTPIIDLSALTTIFSNRLVLLLCLLIAAAILLVAAAIAIRKKK